MNYIKNHKYCIEERAKSLFGTTEYPEFAGYILENGDMLNFSYGGYQRDEDHRIIGQFFSNAQGTDAMLKFMRRGNIRVMCSNSHYYFELINKPTKQQFNRLREAFLYAYKNNIDFLVERSNPQGRIIRQYYDTCELMELLPYGGM